VFVNVCEIGVPEPAENPPVPVSPLTVQLNVVPITVGTVLRAMLVVPPLQNVWLEGVATTTGTGFTVQFTELVFELQPSPPQFLLVSMMVVADTPPGALAVMLGTLVLHEDHDTPLFSEYLNSSSQVPVPPLPLTTFTESAVPAHTGLVFGVRVMVGATGSATTCQMYVFTGERSQPVPAQFFLMAMVYVAAVGVATGLSVLDQAPPFT